MFEKTVKILQLNLWRFVTFYYDVRFLNKFLLKKKKIPKMRNARHGIRNIFFKSKNFAQRNFFFKRQKWILKENFLLYTMRYVNLNNYEFWIHQNAIFLKIKYRIVSRKKFSININFWFLKKKAPLRKIFRFEKNIPLRNIADSTAEFRNLGIPQNL